MSLRQWLWLWVLSCFWGSAFIFMELALPTFSPVMIVMGRMGVAAVLLNLSLWRSSLWRSRQMAPEIKPETMLSSQLKEMPDGQMPNGPVPGEQVPDGQMSDGRSLSMTLLFKCAGLSLLNNLLPFGLVVWGQQHISASLASILIAAAPLFTVVLAVFWDGERLTVMRSLGVVLGFAGVVVLIGPEVLSGFDLKGLGDLAILGAALSYAVAGFMGRRFKAVPFQLLSTLTVTTGALLMGILTGVLMLASPDSLITEWRWSAALAVLFLGIFPTASAYLIYYRLLAQVGVVNVSLVSFLVPLSTLVLGAVFLGERLDIASFVGMGLILSGLAVLDGRIVKGFSS